MLAKLVDIDNLESRQLSFVVECGVSIKQNGSYFWAFF